MSVNTTIGLAYCAENEAQAQAIAQDLGSAVSFRHFAAGGDHGAAPLSRQARGFEGPLILLISDNFLRSLGCMQQGLAFLQEHQHHLLPVVIDGVKRENGHQEPIHTSFERVTDIIQYINFWQDQYLDLRRQKRELSGLDEQAFNDHLKQVREISSEAGEFLRQLRAVYHLQYPEFVVDDYHQLFIFLEDENSWDNYKRQRALQRPPQAAAPTPPTTPAQPDAEDEEEESFDILDDIPGISLLPHDDEPLEVAIPTPSAEVPEPAPEIPQPSDEFDQSEEIAEEITAEEDEKMASDTDIDLDDQAALLIRKAWTLVDENQSDAAATILGAGVETYPQRTDLRYHYALLLAQQQHNLQGAREQLQVVLESEPEHEDALFMLGELADLVSDPVQARHYFEAVLSLNEDYPEAWYRLGVVLAQAFPAEKEATAHAFKRAVKQDHDNADAHYQYAQVLLAMPGKEKKARKQLKETLELAPDHPQAYLDLAISWRQDGDYQRAWETYQAAVLANPALRTTANDNAFQPPSPAREFAPVGAVSASGTFEHDALAALKANIARLEELLQAREEAEAAEQTALEEATPPPPPPRPGAGKTVLVSGATSGIGLATAERFAQDGYRVIITGRRTDRLESLRQDWQDAYQTEVLTLAFDIRDQAAVQAAIDALPEHWQQIDILVNNAGKAKGLNFIHEGHLAHWEEMIDTNIKGLLYLTRAISPRMVARGHGHIINVCSTAGHEVYPKGNVYSATKFAVDALTKGMRIDLHDKGVRVSQVSPAHVEETEFALVRFDGDNERARIYDDFKPLAARDVAETIHFIATQPAYVNILDVVMQGVQQASSTIIDRSGRTQYEEEE